MACRRRLRFCFACLVVFCMKIAFWACTSRKSRRSCDSEARQEKEDKNATAVVVGVNENRPIANIPSSLAVTTRNKNKPNKVNIQS